MAEQQQSKFAGALGRLKRPPAPPTAEAEVAEISPRPEPTTKAADANGSRGGKRSNPEFSATTFFVRKQTKRKAARLLEDTNAGKDLSDLVEELLNTWISTHPHA